MPAVCLVAQKPRECTQEYVIIEGADKGRRCRDRRSCPYKAPSDFARDRPKSGGVRESRSQRQGPMSQDAYRPPVAVFADHASPHRADHVAPELGAKPRRAGATLSRTASVSACLPGKPRGSLGGASPRRAPDHGICPTRGDLGAARGLHGRRHHAVARRFRTRRASRPAWRRKWINSLRAAGRSSASADGHTQNISNRSQATSNRVPDATTRILKIGDRDWRAKLAGCGRKSEKKHLRDCVASR
jgi:hypothetical protein